MLILCCNSPIFLVLLLSGLMVTLEISSMGFFGCLDHLVDHAECPQIHMHWWKVGFTFRCFLNSLAFITFRLLVAILCGSLELTAFVAWNWCVSICFNFSCDYSYVSCLCVNVLEITLLQYICFNFMSLRCWLIFSSLIWFDSSTILILPVFKYSSHLR